MQVTDIHRISEPLRQLAEWAMNQYEGAGSGTARNVGVTSIIQPTQITVLTRQHDWEMSIDLVDCIELLLGQSIALLLKHKTGLTDTQGWSAPIHDDHGNVWTIHGTPDYYFMEGSTITIQDYKVTKTSAVKHGMKLERVQQLSVYAWLMDNPFPSAVLRGENVNLLKDWNRYRVGKSKGYPEHAVVVTEADLLSIPETTAFLQRRVTELEESLRVKPKPCTPDETWGGKRCEYYCPVARWCQQFAGASHHGPFLTDDGEFMDTE